MRRIAFASILLFLASFISISCDNNLPTPCDVDDDCCPEGPAYLCQQGECVYNDFVADDPRVYSSREQICSGENPSGVGGSGSGFTVGPGPVGPGPTSGPGAGPDQCSGNPEQIGTQELAQSNVSRDGCQFPTGEEDNFCSQNDAQIASLPTTSIYNSLLNDLRQQAGISSAVPIYATPDLGYTANIAGGVTGHGLVFVDAKFLDILLEISQYLGMQAVGETGDDLIGAFDSIVQYHNMYPGTNVGPGYYIANTSDGAQIADFIFHDLAGAIMYHEFGHYWAWGCIDQLRSQYGGGGVLNYWPSKIEDDADLISGVLSAKAGHSLFHAQMMLDLMAFSFLQRSGYVWSFSEVASGYNQYMQSTPSYSSLAQRKQIIARGYDDWNLYGN